MARTAALRLLSLLVVLLLVSLCTFLLMHGLPGGPWAVGERPLTEVQRAAFEARYGLDRPLAAQYIGWLGGVLRFDWGYSFAYPDERVLGLIARTWPATLLLGGLALGVAFGMGLPLGIGAAYIHAHGRARWLDRTITLLAVVGSVVPGFVWAILLILFFSVRLGWFPTGGWAGPRTWALPVVAYAFGPMAIVVRFTRVAVLDALRADSVRTARAKGLPERLVMIRHVLRAAAAPLVVVLAPLVPDLITGSIFIEQIFRVPGLGRFWVTSTFERDYPMILGLTLLWALLIAITYAAADLVAAALDPRLRVA